MQLIKAKNLFFIAIIGVLNSHIFAQKIDTSSNRVKTDLTFCIVLK